MTLVRADKLFRDAKGWLVLTGDVPLYFKELKHAKAYIGDRAMGDGLLA